MDDIQREKIKGLLLGAGIEPNKGSAERSMIANGLIISIEAILGACGQEKVKTAENVSEKTSEQKARPKSAWRPSRK